MSPLPEGKGTVQAVYTKTKKMKTGPRVKKPKGKPALAQVTRYWRLKPNTVIEFAGANLGRSDAGCPMASSADRVGNWPVPVLVRREGVGLGQDRDICGSPPLPWPHVAGYKTKDNQATMC